MIGDLRTPAGYRIHIAHLLGGNDEIVITTPWGREIVRVVGHSYGVTVNADRRVYSKEKRDGS